MSSGQVQKRKSNWATAGREARRQYKLVRKNKLLGRYVPWNSACPSPPFNSQTGDS